MYAISYKSIIYIIDPYQIGSARLNRRNDRTRQRPKSSHTIWLGLHSAMQSAAVWTINESQKHYQNSCEERKIGKTLARKIDKISKQPIMNR